MRAMRVGLAAPGHSSAQSPACRRAPKGSGLSCVMRQQLRGTPAPQSRACLLCSGYEGHMVAGARS